MRGLHEVVPYLLDLELEWRREVGKEKGETRAILVEILLHGLT